jgi:hypothetical protein
MRRLRTVLILRGLLALFFLVLGVVLLAQGRGVSGVFAIVVAITNGALIAALVRRQLRIERGPGA